MMQVMLIGNPNCGKTTLFNALTGESQRVGNWPGVTVEKKTGYFDIAQRTTQLIDLPGLYSLTVPHQGVSQDEMIAAQAICCDEVDVVINVVDACQLERHLYLTTQILELGKPVVIALNMMDIALQRGIIIDTNALSLQMGCAVIPMQAHRHQGLAALKQAVLDAPAQTLRPFALPMPKSLREILGLLQSHNALKQMATPQLTFYWSNRLLEGDALVLREPAIQALIPEESDVLMADARYQAVHEVVEKVQKKRSDASEHLTAKIDRIVLHRFLALPIFFVVMYAMFFMAISVGGALQDFFDISSDAIFVQGSAFMLHALDAPQWLIALIANGIGKGINTAMTFIPVIASMFFFLALLETSGYMARAAFVVDKAMRMLGLPGKSFVPMIVGFGCNVPAIMAARTLDSERDRLLTVLMSPFMSCSARLAIYAIFVATFFPIGGHNIVFSLYIVGILMAVLTGLLLRKTIFQGSTSPLLLELPAYHKPSVQRLIKETSMRLRHFIFRAGKLIIPVCMLLGGLNAVTLHGSSESILSVFGQWLTPLFAPMGLHQDNWPATMGLLTGMLAKEVVVGTLDSLYAQIGHVSQATTLGFDFWASIQAALRSIPDNIIQLGPTIIHPFTSVMVGMTVPSAVGAVMVSHFDGQIGAYAYLLFVLLYIPCVSTMAVIQQEAGHRLMFFSITWSLVLAYGVSVTFYQLATILVHPAQSLLCVLCVMMFLFGSVQLMRVMLKRSGGLYVIAAS